jgi:hypothetical protein
MAKREPKAWAVGDPCPNDGGALRLVPAPSDEQRRLAASKDASEWVPLPRSTDSAEPSFVAEYGALYRCPDCGYESRADAPAPAAAGAAPGAGTSKE